MRPEPSLGALPLQYCTVYPLRIGTVVLPGFMANAGSDAQVDLGVWAFLIDSGDTKVLFDGGLVGDMTATCAHIEAEIGDRFGYLEADAGAVQAALVDIGVRPSDIDVAVLSHLHHDHAGAIEWLPNAMVWVHADELELLESPYANKMAPCWQVTAGTRRTIDDLDAQGRLTAWTGEVVDLCETIRLHKVGGHTAGSVALIADVRSDWRVALLGDLFTTETQIESGLIPMSTFDAYATIRSISMLLGSADELWPGHAISGSVQSVDAIGSWPRLEEWSSGDA